MSPQIQIRPHQERDLRRIFEAGWESIEKVSSNLNKNSDVILSTEALLEAFCTAIEDTDTAERLLRQALALHGITSQGKFSVDETLNALGNALTFTDLWTEENEKQWPQIQSSLHGLLNSPCIESVSAAIDLSYEYTNLLRDSRILTDIRPLFTKDGAGITGSVISQTLRLLYTAADGDHALSIAMDESDIEKLKDQCDRALTKAQAAKSMMIEKAEVPTNI